MGEVEMGLVVLCTPWHDSLQLLDHWAKQVGVEGGEDLLATRFRPFHRILIRENYCYAVPDEGYNSRELDRHPPGFGRDGWLAVIGRAFVNGPPCA